MEKKSISLHRLIEKLTDNAMTENVCSCRPSTGEKPRPLSKQDMPGYRIQQLTPEEREVLSTATSKDFSWRGFR
jgi:hypothetical protein